MLDVYLGKNYNGLFFSKTSPPPRYYLLLTEHVHINLAQYLSPTDSTRL